VQAFFRLWFRATSAKFQEKAPGYGGREISEPRRFVNARHLCRCTGSKRHS